jgi:acyl carrier protein
MKTVSHQPIINIVAHIAGCKPGTLSPGTDLYADLKMDSLTTLELLVELEEEFHVDIETAQAERIRTIADITLLLNELLPFSGKF